MKGAFSTEGLTFATPRHQGVPCGRRRAGLERRVHAASADGGNQRLVTLFTQALLLESGHRAHVWMGSLAGLATVGVVAP